MGTICVIDGSGDTRITWDPEDEHSVENARRTFNDLTQKGHMAFSVHEKGKNVGEKNKRITEFDHNLDKIIFIAPMSGGSC